MEAVETFPNGVIVVPEALLGDMTRIGVIIILEIPRSEILPGIMVLAAMLVGYGRIQSLLVQRPHSHHEVVAVGLCLGGQRGQRDSQAKDGFPHHAQSSNNNELSNASALSTSS